MATQAVKRNVLQQFVERASSLYSLPAVAMEVLELTGQPNVDTAALGECVERDPALTAKLLRVVNSSMFGLSREVSDLTQALALLGVKPLKLLVLGFSLPKQLVSEVESQALHQFWQFTIVKAVAARELSKLFWSKTEDEAFIAALLQEIGILVLVNELGDSYLNFLSSVHERRENLIALETATLGFDHAILSARLLDHWNLPTQIVQAVSVPQETEYIKSLDTEEATLPQTMHLATLLALIIVNDRRDLMPDLLSAASEYRGISVEQIDALLDSLQEQVQEMASMFSVTAEQSSSFRDIVAQAHRQMADAALDALPLLVGGNHARPVHAEREELSDALEQYAQDFLDLTGAASSSGQREAPAVRRRATDMPTAEGTLARKADIPSSDPGLNGRINAAIAASRSRQREVSLLLTELDRFEDLLVMYGPDRMLRVVSAVAQAIKNLSDLPCECHVISDARVAVILPDCERQQAVRLARSLNDAVPVWMMEHGQIDASFSFSAGIASLATPTRSSRPEDLIAAADRCLFAAHRSGGGAIKGIDVL